MNDVILSVSDFVGLLNQTLEFAYPSVTIVGELSNFRVSKNRWVYFDLKDEYSSVKFFGTVYQLPGPLEDGLTIQVSGSPRLHQLYGFSVNVTSMRPVGEGSIKKAADLLMAKLDKEGLFDPARKRDLPYPPSHIGLITSGESAAYHDFVKILGERFGGIDITLCDTQVQGEAAVGQIVMAIEKINGLATPPEVIVITRGGGSADDLAAFSSEQVTRAVAASRVPTIVAIGHEVDVSLAELAADRRASTPSNAAQMLTPDKHQVLSELSRTTQALTTAALNLVKLSEIELKNNYQNLSKLLHNIFIQSVESLAGKKALLSAYSPQAVLERGYAIVRHNGKNLPTNSKLRTGQDLEIETAKAYIDVTTKAFKLK